MDAKLIVSLTSYPARIHFVPAVVENMWKQTRQPDAVTLWLSSDEFPAGLSDCPAEVQKLVEADQLAVYFKEGNLKPHKKYIYSMQEFPEDIIVTVDDDLDYPDTMLEMLYDAYLAFPTAVSAMRVHLMLLGEDNCFLPYETWVHETKACHLTPSLQLLATGGAGTLYPPHLFSENSMLFQEVAIKECCLEADDLWLKAAELEAHIPVVLANDKYGLHYIAGSQEATLWQQNGGKNRNDIQLAAVSVWYAESHGGETLETVFQTRTETGTILTKAEVVAHIKANCEQLSKRLSQAYQEKSELNAKLQQTYAEKSELNAKLQKTYAEKAERGERIKELEQELRKNPVHQAKRLFKK